MFIFVTELLQTGGNEQKMRQKSIEKGIVKLFRGIVYLTMMWHLSVIAFSCRQPSSAEWIPDPDADLNVYFFHINDRCPACLAVEDNTEWVLDNYFSERLEDGSIKYESFNIDMKENKAVTSKYRISYTSLLLVRRDGKVTDLTVDAMNNAGSAPLKFREMLKTEIESNLE